MAVGLGLARGGKRRGAVSVGGCGGKKVANFSYASI